MSLSRRILFGAAASWFSRGVTILLGLVLMPVLFRTLPKEELGLWLLIGQSWATLGILDFGFGVTLTRRIAFAKARSGTDPSSPLNSGSLDELADLAATGVRLYRILSLVSFAVPLVLGFFYLRSLALESIALPEVWLAWGLLCLSQALSVWATPWTCLLQGVGHVGWDALIGTFVNALALVAQIVVALCGGGLVALATVAAAGALAQRVAILGFAKRKRPELFALRGRWRGEVVKSMAPLAWRAWLTGVGAVLVLQTDQLFIAKFEGTRELPAYRASYVILLNLNMIAVTLASSSAVFVAHLWKGGEPAIIHDIVIRNLRTGLFIMAAGGAWLLALGPHFFDLWLGSGNFVGYPILLTFFVMLFLEAQCYITSTASRATEDEAFAFSSMLSGVLKILFSLLLLEPFGLLGVALGTLFAQLTTNHWFMVLKSMHRLKLNMKEHMLRVIAPTTAIFALVWLGTTGIKHLPFPWSAVLKVALSSVLATSILFGFSWKLLLSPSNRTQILGSLKLGIRIE